MIQTPLRNATAGSLLLHMAIFGMMSAITGRAPRAPVVEYIPVELVQITPAQEKKTYLPAAPPAPVVQQSKASPAPAPTPAPQQSLTMAPENTPQLAPAAMAVPVRNPEPTASRLSVAPASPGTATRNTTAEAPASGPKTDAPVYQPIHRLTRLPNYLSRIEPVYPVSERMAGIEARVLTEIYLNSRGGVDEVKIKKSGGKPFDQAVIAAVRNSRFSPGFMGEVPVPTVLQIPFSFKMK